MDKLETPEKPQLKKWQKSMILIAHPDGHNFVKSQNLNGDHEGFFVSKKFDESDIQVIFYALNLEFVLKISK